MLFSRNFLIVSVALGLFSIPSFGDDPTNLLSLKIIESDLSLGASLLRRLDKNGDKQLDRSEREAHDWGSQESSFDIDRNGKFSLTEVVIWHTKRRAEHDIKSVDQNTALNRMRQYDKTKDNILSAEEIKAAGWPDDPAAFDTDGNGELTLFEISSEIARGRIRRKEKGVYGIDMSCAFAVMQTFDGDKNRRIDGTEYAKATYRGSKLPGKAEDYDGDGDAMLTLEELAAMFAVNRQQRGVEPHQQVKSRRMISRYDTNFDGKLSEEELKKAGLEGLLKSLGTDANGDLLLSLLELENGFAKRDREKKESEITAKDAYEAARLVVSYDTDANGVITLDETDENPERRPYRGVAISTLMFIEYDINADEQLDRRELAAFFSVMRKKQAAIEAKAKATSQSKPTTTLPKGSTD